GGGMEAGPRGAAEDGLAVELGQWARGEVAGGLAADTARRRSVGGIQRRITDRIVDGEQRDAGFAQRPRDRAVGGSLVEILDEDIDAAARRVGGIVERRAAVAAIVVEHEIDREPAGGENEALPNLAPREPRT